MQSPIKAQLEPPVETNRPHWAAGSQAAGDAGARYEPLPAPAPEGCAALPPAAGAPAVEGVDGAELVADAGAPAVEDVDGVELAAPDAAPALELAVAGAAGFCVLLVLAGAAVVALWVLVDVDEFPLPELLQADSENTIADMTATASAVRLNFIEDLLE